jgi:polar amino acid transport system substrate-binding protein
MKTKRLLRGVAVFIFSLFLFGLLIGSPAKATESKLNTITKSGKLRVGWANWLPYIYMDPKTNKLTGFTLDFYEEMAKVLNVKTVWIEDKWATLNAGLAADKFDVICNANKSLQRAMVSEFAGPITKTSMRYLVRKNEVGTGKRFVTSNDVDKKGVRIGIAMGSTSDKKLTDMLKNAELVRLPGDPDVILGIRTKKVDVYATDEMTLILLEKDYPELTILPGAWSSSEMGLYVPQGDQVLLNWVNWFIWDMKENGKIQEWLDKYSITGVTIVPNR